MTVYTPPKEKYYSRHSTHNRLKILECAQKVVLYFQYHYTVKPVYSGRPWDIAS